MTAPIRQLVRIAILLLLGTTVLHAQQRTLFKDVRVFDGLNLMPSTNVLVEGRTITAMGHEIAVPPGTDTILGSGKTLLPGFIDAHAHLASTPSADELERSIQAGVTTVLDMFSDPAVIRRVRAAQEAGGLLDRAELYSAGTIITAPGGYGTGPEFGLAIPTLTRPEAAAA